MYIGRTLFQNVLSADPKIEVAMAMPSSEIMFWKRFLDMYTCAYIRIYSYVKRSFLKHNNHPWHWYCKPIIWNGA